MFLDIPHGDLSDPDYLTITVALNRSKRDVAFISFILPSKADKSAGMAIAFANSEKNDNGDWQVRLAEGTTRILKFENCASGDCTVRVMNGVIPASDGAPAINLLDQFEKNRMVLLYYWVDGKRVRAGATLSGFQLQYPLILNNDLRHP